MPTPALHILYQDDDLVAVNKPSGLLTEGGGAQRDDLEQRVAAMLGSPVYCCHRLDRLTSGVVLLRRNARHRTALAALFEKRQVRKEYWAIVEGEWDRSLKRIETSIGPLGGGRWGNVASGGKQAVSTIQVLGRQASSRRTWLRILLKTGRTHQARLHGLAGGCPVVGDPLYGHPSPDGFFGLHARQLSLRHPGTGQQIALVAPVGESWRRELESMKGVGSALL